MIGESVFMKPSAGPCEIHEWPDDGLAKRLLSAMRERHSKGGINVCRACVERAKADAKLVLERAGGLP